MSTHRSLIAFAALTALTFPATALAADSTGTSGTLESVEINHSTADTYLQYHGRIVIEGGGRMTEYRWGGTSCSNKTLPLELVAMLWDALAQRDATADAVEQTRRSIERSTRNAYQGLVAGISEVEARRLALVSAQSAYDASQVGLEVGTRTVLDVLNNQRTLFSAQQAYAQAKYNFLQSRLLLEQAAGTLEISDVEDVNRLLTTDESVTRGLGTP